MLWNELRIESYAKVYEEMSKVCSEIICMTNESMEKVRLSRPRVWYLLTVPENIVEMLCDVYSRQYIRDAGWNIDEFLDMVHCKRSFERKILTVPTLFTETWFLTGDEVSDFRKTN